MAVSFLVLEGPDGAGKSTQVRRLQAAFEARGREVAVVREPGGTAVGERVRDILLDPRLTDMALRSELLLYMASRAQLVVEMIEPALRRGALVISDRFVYSSMVYQGSAGGLDVGEIARIGDFAANGLEPDIVFLIDIDAEKGLNRIRGEHDRMEARGIDFHIQVRQGFLDLAAARPELFRVIDGARSEDDVFEQIKGYIGEL